MPHLFIMPYFPWMLHIARVFRSIFKIKRFHKYYFGFYKRLFKPYNIFKDITTYTKFDSVLQMKVDLVLQLDSDRNKVFDFFKQMNYNPFVLNDDNEITPPQAA